MKNLYLNSVESTNISHGILLQKIISIRFRKYILHSKLLNESITQIKSLIMQDDSKSMENIILKVGGFILI